MGSPYSTSNINVLVTDFDNDDFFTKFLANDSKYLCYSIKNTIPTIQKHLQKINKKQTNISNQQTDIKHITSNIFKSQVPVLTLDSKNKLEKIPKNDFISFKKIIKSNIFTRHTPINNINIIIDISCFAFLGIIDILIRCANVKLHNITINFVNNLTSQISFNDNPKIDNTYFNDILLNLYNTCKTDNIEIAYLLYDYCKSIKSTPLLEQPLYHESLIMNIIPKKMTGGKKSDIYKLLFDYYTIYYDGKIPFYPLFMHPKRNGELEICKNIVSIRDVDTPPEFYLSGFDYYVFKDENIKPRKHFNNYITNIFT